MSLADCRRLHDHRTAFTPAPFVSFVLQIKPRQTRRKRARFAGEVREKSQRRQPYSIESKTVRKLAARNTLICLHLWEILYRSFDACVYLILCLAKFCGLTFSDTETNPEPTRSGNTSTTKTGRKCSWCIRLVTSENEQENPSMLQCCLVTWQLANPWLHGLIDLYPILYISIFKLPLEYIYRGSKKTRKLVALLKNASCSSETGTLVGFPDSYFC